jgi:hypothetical protein
MNGSCLCGAVTVTLAGPPDYMNQCNCTACFKLGTLWGYYTAGQVTVAGHRQVYARDDMAEPSVSFDFCGRCGATIRWAPVPGNPSPRTGINMRLFDPAALRGIEVRYGDRRNHQAIEPRRYARDATIFGEGGPLP